MGLTLGQACLLGFWAAYSGRPWWLRLGGLVAGAVGLEFLVEFGTGEDDFRGMATIAAGVNAAVLWLSGSAGPGSAVDLSTAGGSARQGFRFSIGGLMLFTLGVAVVFARGRPRHLRPAGPEPGRRRRLEPLPGGPGTGRGLGGPGARPPLFWAPCVLARGIAFVALFAYGIGEDRDWESITYFITITAGQLAPVLGSLLALRGAGYRLVGRSSSAAESPHDAFAGNDWATQYYSVGTWVHY